MSLDFATRFLCAQKLMGPLSQFFEGLLVVGSVAYNPQAVTAASDLDLIGIVDFSQLNFPELYDQLGLAYEPNIEQYAKSGRINTFSLVWDESFEIGLHIWDVNAFQNVVELSWPNKVFRREVGHRNFVSTANVETLKNLLGHTKEIKKHQELVEGGAILDLYPCFEDETGFYLGIQCSNLALSPMVLSDQGTIRAGLDRFYINLEAKKREYPSGSVYNALAEKVQQKLPDDLRELLQG